MAQYDDFGSHVNRQSPTFADAAYAVFAVAIPVALGDIPRMVKRSGKPRKPSGGRRQGGAAQGRGLRRDDAVVLLYGIHAVKAALANPGRRLRRLLATDQGIAALKEAGASLTRVQPEITDRESLNAMLMPDTPHQGLVLETDHLEEDSLFDLLAGLGEDRPALLVVLDQITDPQNMGAILRSCAAFGAAGVVATERHSAQAGGALAKAASGALEIVPICRETNLVRALDQLAEAGFWRIGLDGAAGRVFNGDDAPVRLALVLGAEGKGLRRLTREHCDELAGLPMSGQMESLNVSNAAAVALYEARRKFLRNDA
jgi:23S rRNA (guanosine2251-2'-O)-methyltransferase